MKKQLKRCKGLESVPCYGCKRYDPLAGAPLVSTLGQIDGRAVCNHFILKR